MTISHHRARRGRCRRRGAVAFEFAMVLPIFILAMIGIIEFGRAVMVQQILVNAAREGTRRAIVPGATDSAVTTLVDDYLVNATLGAEGRQVQIVDADGNPVSLADVNSHDVVAVRVTVPYNEVGVGIGSYFSDTTMGALVQMRKE